MNNGKSLNYSVLLLLCSLLLLFCAACGFAAPPESGAPDASGTAPAEASSKSQGAYDLDLTRLDSNMIYATIYNMMEFPEKYVGQYIRIRGNFTASTIEGTTYFSCIIPDATACCSQGLEFVLARERAYPAEYPKKGSEITVSGIFEIYWEGEYYYCRLKDAELEKEG